MSERRSLGLHSDTDQLINAVSKGPNVARPQENIVKNTAAASGFTRRTQNTDANDGGGGERQARRLIKRRSQQLNVRVSDESFNEFYGIVNETGMTCGAAFDYLIQLHKERLANIG